MLLYTTQSIFDTAKLSGLTVYVTEDDIVKFAFFFDGGHAVTISLYDETESIADKDKKAFAQALHRDIYEAWLADVAYFNIVEWAMVFSNNLAEPEATPESPYKRAIGFYDNQK